MKIINLKRGHGKTTRLLYASEFNSIPILCEGRAQKKLLLDKAIQLGLSIPEPITVQELITGHLHLSKILIDEALSVLQCLLKSLGVDEISAIALTADKM